MPKITKEFRQTILMNPLYRAGKNKQDMDRLFEREEVPDDHPIKNELPKDIQEMMDPKVKSKFNFL
jgi:arginine/lysine/ornithine decarboxylase